MSKSFKIILRQNKKDDFPVDCSCCGFALRDFEDVISQRIHGKCTDCRTNYPKRSEKDN